jgi:hypothetical protein
MFQRERIRTLRQPATYVCGYLWRVNHISCYYEILEVKLDDEPGWWDCWTMPYGGNAIHYSKNEYKELELYSTPDEAMFAMFVSNKYQQIEWTFDRVKAEAQSYLDYDGKRVSFMFTAETFAEKFMEYESVEEFSDFLEAYCEDILGIFEF